MVLFTQRVLVLMLCLAAVCAAWLTPTEHAQTGKTITIRILDSKTARPIAVSNFLVRINHQQAFHGGWVRLNENGSGKFTVPGDAAVVSIHATYDSSHANVCQLRFPSGEAEPSRALVRGLRRSLPQGL